MLKNLYKANLIEAGCDEAGRGCLAGPVFAAAVILPVNYSNPFLNDSKKLTVRQRSQLRLVIEKDAIDFAIGKAEVEEIDSLNILNASYLAVHRALEKLTIIPQHIIMDGNSFISFKNIPHTCIVKGDASYYSIAAASILAKTCRDDYMLDLHMKFPQYGWNKNKGYPTIAHREAIAKYGTTKYHRMSFKLCS